MSAGNSMPLQTVNDQNGICPQWLSSCSRVVRGGWLESRDVSSVVQLVLETRQVLQLLQLLELPVGLVADQRPVEVDGEDDEDHAERYHDGCGGDGGSHTSTDGAVPVLCRALALRFDGQELDPAEQDDLGQEEKRADDGGEGPGQLYVAVHPLMRRLIHRVQVVYVADGLNVGQNAGADHQGKQVNSYQNSGAGTECDQQARMVVIGVVKLDFHHCHLDGTNTGYYQHTPSQTHASLPNQEHADLRNAVAIRTGC